MKKLNRKNLSLIMGGAIWHCMCGGARSGMTVTSSGSTANQAGINAIMACGGYVVGCTSGASA